MKKSKDLTAEALHMRSRMLTSIRRGREQSDMVLIHIARGEWRGGVDFHAECVPPDVASELLDVIERFTQRSEEPKK